MTNVEHVLKAMVNSGFSPMTAQEVYELLDLTGKEQFHGGVGQLKITMRDMQYKTNQLDAGESQYCNNKALLTFALSERGIAAAKNKELIKTSPSVVDILESEKKELPPATLIRAIPTAAELFPVPHKVKDEAYVGIMTIMAKLDVDTPEACLKAIDDLKNPGVYRLDKHDTFEVLLVELAEAYRKGVPIDNEREKCDLLGLYEESETVPTGHAEMFREIRKDLMR